MAGDVPCEQLRDKIVIVGFLESSWRRQTARDDARERGDRRRC